MRSYFLQQNAAIQVGSVKGLPINLKVLGVGDGLTVGLHFHLGPSGVLIVIQDPLSQYPGYISYAASNP